METNPFQFVDFGKLMEQYKLPGVDFGALVERQRKDIEALTEANRIAAEGIQALAKKEAEILQKTMQEVMAAMSKAPTGDPMASASKQADLAQQAFGKALANMRELAEVASKSQSDAYAVISKRVQENIQELTALMQPKK
ncbi:MAG TPA: TIGR01841 family phasin [Burkholderiales bacterium]|nr:TIGR01841 family phasin [Burkholderiales bacterium]